MKGTPIFQWPAEVLQDPTLKGKNENTAKSTKIVATGFQTR
jgi:hypothetical protein